MTKFEFLSKLEKAMFFLSDNEKQEILIDFEDYFDGEIENGRREEEIAEHLGNPVDIAMQYNSGDRQAPSSQNKKDTYVKRNTSDTRIENRTQSNSYKDDFAQDNNNMKQNCNFEEDFVSSNEKLGAPQKPIFRRAEPNSAREMSDNVSLTYEEKTVKNPFKGSDNNNNGSNTPRTNVNSQQASAKTSLPTSERVWRIIATVLLDFAFFTLFWVIFGLYVAGWSVAGACGISFLIAAFASFATFAHVGIMIGAFLLFLGLALLCVGLGYAMVKATTGIVKLVKKIVDFNIYTVKECIFK